MAARALLPVLILLLASCVPQAFARQELPDDPAELTVEAVRELPPERLPEVIDSVTAPGSPAEPFLAAANGRALDCLTAAVYYEARSEPLDGQRAVAQVVLNRVRHRAFPQSVCGVVFQGRERRTGCQFSFTCDGSMHRGREPGAWGRAREVAAAALSGYVFAPVGLATHFHTTAIRPWWASSMRRAITVGAHIFYRWPGQWGNPLAFRAPYHGQEGGVPAVATAHAADPGDGTGAPPATEVVMGVTIHRSTAPPPVMRMADAAPTPSLPASRTVRVRRGGQTIAIHRGGPPPVALAADLPASAPVSDASAMTR